MSNLQSYYHFKLDLKKVGQHTGGTWLIHGTKRHKDNQGQMNFFTSIQPRSNKWNGILDYHKVVYTTHLHGTVPHTHV